MKFNKLYIAFLMLAMSLVYGCDEWEDTVKPSPAAPEGCQGVYFPSSNQPVFELEPNDATEITMSISRTESAGSVDVPITVEINTDDVFAVPSMVAFADGETEVDFTITFPNAAAGVAYSLKLAVVGDEYINQYSSHKSYVSTMVSRIKWETVTEPMVYLDGAFNGIYSTGTPPMYVKAQKAQLGESVRYRFLNAYKDGTGAWDGDSWVATPDADGIYDGFPYTWPGEFDDTKDWYTTIEIYDASGTSGDVAMNAHEIGVQWSNGMMSMGSIYGNISDDQGKYPLGTMKDGVITFPANSLYFSEAGRNEGGKYPSAVPTTIYLTKEAYIAANKKIEDFNDVEYKTIEGEVSEFASAAYSESWSQTIGKAVDIDSENPDSEYKDLYYLANLYADGKGLAFYYKDDKLTIPANQPMGMNIFGQPVFLSPSKDIKSSVEVNAKGVTVYTLGLLFHYEDGTIVGEFAETHFYAKAAPSYDASDFVGNFKMTAPSLFQGGEDANMDVVITAGVEANSLVIAGIQYAEAILATFNPETSTMSIAPQALADYGPYDMTLYTYTDAPSASANIDLSINMLGNLVIAQSSEAVGYLLSSDAAGGWVDGYYNLLFTRVASSIANVKSLGTQAVQTYSSFSWTENTQKAEHNFKIQGKLSPRSERNSVEEIIIF